MIDDEKHCPLMGGSPCMGRRCACATSSRFKDGTWHCGFVSDNYAIDMEAHATKEGE